MVVARSSWLYKLATFGCVCTDDTNPHTQQRMHGRKFDGRVVVALYWEQGKLAEICPDYEDYMMAYKATNKTQDSEDGQKGGDVGEGGKGKLGGELKPEGVEGAEGQEEQKKNGDAGALELD